MEIFSQFGKIVSTLPVAAILSISAAMFGLYFVVPEPINYIVSVLIIVSLINAINLMDGLDGMASGISSIYFLTIAIVAFILNRVGGLDIILSNEYSN